MQSTRLIDVIAPETFSASCHCTKSGWFGALLLFVLGLLAASQGNEPEFKRFVVLLAVLVEEGSLTLMWILAAAGWGWLVSLILPNRDSLAVQLHWVLVRCHCSIGFSDVWES